MLQSYMESYLQNLTAHHDNGLPVIIEQDNAPGHKPSRRDPTRRLSDEEIINQWLSTDGGAMLLLENYGSSCGRWQEHADNISKNNDEGESSSDDNDVVLSEAGAAPPKPLRRQGSSQSSLNCADAENEMLLQPRKPMMRRQGSSESTLSFSFAGGGENSSIVFGPNDVPTLPPTQPSPPSSKAPRKPLRRKGSSESTLSLQDVMIQNKPMCWQGSCSESSLGFGSSSSLGFESSSSLGFGTTSSDSSLGPQQRLHYGVRKHMQQLVAAAAASGAPDSASGGGNGSFSSSSSSFSTNSSYSSSLSPPVPVQEESALEITGLGATTMRNRLPSFDADESLHLLLFDSQHSSTSGNKDCAHSSSSPMRMPIRQTSSSDVISSTDNGACVGPQAA